MKLSFKTLQQKSFTIDIEDEKLVNDLKSKLSIDLACDNDQLKLIFKGKILDDLLKCSEIGASEKDFIVVMVTKKKVQTASPMPATPTPTSASKSPAKSPAVAPASTTSTVVPNVPTPTPATTTNDENTLATGSALQTAVSNLCDMGFPRDQVMLAMRAAFNNPDRAAEYLMTVIIGNQGIPENLQQEQPAPQQQATPTTQAPAPQSGYVNLFNQGAQQAQTTPAAQASGNLDFLRQSPQFLQLRQMVQQRPELLQPLLQELSHNNPELINVHLLIVDTN